MKVSNQGAKREITLQINKNPLRFLSKKLRGSQLQSEENMVTENCCPLHHFIRKH